MERLRTPFLALVSIKVHQEDVQAQLSLALQYDIDHVIPEDCASSAHMASMEPFSMRHISAGCSSNLAC